MDSSMFKRILVVEDIEIANYGIVKTLTDNNLISSNNITDTEYCDNAFIQVRKALADDEPYDLLITDLSFDKNRRDERISSGVELIDKIRAIQTDIKVIVYSVEDKISRIKSLFTKQLINGYVCKNSNDSQELIRALFDVYSGKTYKSSSIAHNWNKKNRIQLNDYNTNLLKLLADGHSQKEVSQVFKKNGTEPNSISIIEKRLEKLRDDFNAKNTSHLISIIKDFGLIDNAQKN